MRAEDLNVLNLLVTDFTHDLEKFTGKLDSVSTPGHTVYVGQEFGTGSKGTLSCMRINQIVQPFEPFGGTFQGRNQPNLVMARAFARGARRREASPPGPISAICLGLSLLST